MRLSFLSSESITRVAFSYSLVVLGPGEQQFGFALQDSKRSAKFVRGIGDELPELSYDGIDSGEQLVRIETEDGSRQQEAGRQ